MSMTSKITFVTACGVSASIIGYVHYKQQWDRMQLHEGVIRDVEQQQRRKAENIYVMQQQIELTKQLKQSDPAYANRNT